MWETLHRTPLKVARQLTSAKFRVWWQLGGISSRNHSCTTVSFSRHSRYLTTALVTLIATTLYTVSIGRVSKKHKSGLTRVALVSLESGPPPQFLYVWSPCYGIHSPKHQIFIEDDHTFDTQKIWKDSMQLSRRTVLQKKAFFWESVGKLASQL